MAYLLPVALDEVVGKRVSFVWAGFKTLISFNGWFFLRMARRSVLLGQFSWQGLLRRMLDQLGVAHSLDAE